MTQARLHVTQSGHRVNARGTQGRNRAGSKRGAAHDDDRGEECERIGRTDTGEKAIAPRSSWTVDSTTPVESNPGSIAWIFSRLRRNRTLHTTSAEQTATCAVTIRRLSR
jgi:hypothetical protein